MEVDNLLNNKKIDTLDTVLYKKQIKNLISSCIYTGKHLNIERQLKFSRYKLNIALHKLEYLRNVCLDKFKFEHDKLRWLDEEILRNQVLLIDTSYQNFDIAQIQKFFKSITAADSPNISVVPNMTHNKPTIRNINGK